MLKADPKKIVILGGGFGGMYTCRALARLRSSLGNVHITLVNNTNHFVFTPLLPEVATGSIDPKHLGEPIRAIARCLDAFCEATVTRVSLAEKVVYTDLKNISFDYLVIALGSKTTFFGTPGAEEYAYTLKTLKEARDLKNRCIELFERAAQETDPVRLKQLLSFVIVGGGPTGVELAAELQEFLEESLAPLYAPTLKQYVRVSVVQRAEELVPQFSPYFRDAARNVLTKKGVRLYMNTGVTEVREHEVLLSGDETIAADTTIWTAGVEPIVPEFDTEIKQEPRGRIIVDEHLRVVGHDNVFAIGDVAAYGTPPLPALAQVAVDEAAVVAATLKATILGKALPQDRYQYRSKGTLLSLGRFNAVGEVFGLHFSGFFMWWLWRTIYLSKMYSWRKRLEVMVDWTFDLFTKRDITEL